MNFNQAKDEFLKWCVPALLSALVWQVSELSKDMSTVQTKLIYQSERVDKNELRIDKINDAISTIEVNVGQLKIKIFGKDAEI